jgi:hypothetical protein
MRIFVVALLASGTFSIPALGDDIKSALKEFGLVGTWSPDCGKDISQPRASRVAFAAPVEGGTSATAQDNKGEVVVTTVYDVVESAIVDGDKIRVALHPVTVTKSDGKAASQHDYDNLRLVFQKAGERIEVIRVQFEGLPEIQRASFFEKCLN